jgi:hypothetical protein
MGSIEPIFGDDYRTLVHPSIAVDMNPTLAHSVWRTSLGRDLYEHFKSFLQPFQPHDPPSETGPSSQTMNHLVDQVINPTITPTQVHPNSGIVTSTHLQITSISTPVSTRFYSTTPHVPHDLAGTSSHPRMQTPTGQTQQTRGKPPSNKPFPPGGIPFHGGPTPPRRQPHFHAPLGGKPSFCSHTLIINPPIAGGKPSFARNPSQS